MARKQLGAAPSNAADTATKDYVDTAIAAVELLPGATGASGASGVPGATGPTGATGASGGTGATGGTGGTGGPGTTTWAGITDKPGAILNYKGTWNASTNTPTLSDSTGSGGDVYRVSVAGSRNLGSGTISWEVGDYAIWSPVTSSYEKADTTDAVSSVAGRTGDVTLSVSDLGITGTPSSSVFLRGDGTWSSGPIGATGASGASGPIGATGATGPSGTNYARDIATLTAPATLGASGSTDYVRFLSAGASGDINYSSVTALLSGDGANDGTTITDSSSLAANWTASGNAKLTTATKKFGTASISFNDTSGTYIYPSAAASNFAFSADYTVEFWLYLNSTANAVIIDTRPSGTSSGAYFAITYEGAPKLAVNGTSTAGSALSTSTWYHIAASRSGSSNRLFVNGTQVGTTITDSTSLLCGTNRPMVGNDGFQNGTGDFRLNGLIDDLRITRGVGRYTANFTAPTAAFDNFTKTVGTPTLPAASGALGRYSFRNISGMAITIGASGSQAINGATGGLSLANGSSTELMSDGTGWYSF